MRKFYLYYILFSLAWFAEQAGANFISNKVGSTNINLLNSNITNTSIKITVDGYEFIEVEDGLYEINIDGGIPLLEKGAPNLPALKTSIIIPDNSNMSINIIDYEYEEISGINIAPSKGNLLRNVNPVDISYEYGKEYTSNSFYPNSLTEMREPYILRDLRGQGILIYPFQYNPVSKVLRVYSDITIEVVEDIQLNRTSKNQLLRKSNTVKQSSEFKNIYDNLFINSRNDLRFEYLADQGNMLVISYDSFIEHVQPLVEWKNKKGILTEIVSIADIGSNVEQIKDYISDYYYSNGLTYLLLVGDVAQIPTPIINGASADPSYGFINGDDSFAEVIVGRISAQTPSHVITQVQRIIDYEKNPPNVNHLNKALGIGSNQGPGYAGLTDAAFNDLLWNDFLSDFTYTEFDSVYDGFGGSLELGVSLINEGAGLINYTGHAGSTGWGNGAPLGVNDVQNLTNTNKLPFIITVGCNPGEFNTVDECFCESWMRSTDEDGNPIGAVGHLGSTISQSWEPPMHGQWAMNSILTESYNNNISRTFGGIVVNGCMHMNEAQGANGINETNHWTLFGDPSLMVRTDIPEDIDVEFNNVINVGQQELVLDVGIDGAVAALSSNGELLTYAISNGGVAILDLTNVSNSPGEFDLTITAFNRYAYEETLSVMSTDGAYLVYNDIELVFDSSFNQIFEYGDEIEMNLVVENIGNLNASDINVQVSSDDEYITIVDDSSFISSAIMNEYAYTENTIGFLISNNVPDNHVAYFSAILSSQDLEFQINFSIDIHAPVFEIQNPIISDEDMNGVWDPGELATITVDLLNTGSAPFSQYPGAVISTSSEFVNVLSDENANTFFGIGANDTYQGTFIVQSAENTPLNSEISFNISWGYSSTSPCEENCVNQANLEYSTIIGHPLIAIWDPTDNHVSGNKLTEFLDLYNPGSYDYFTGDQIPTFENYSTVFLFLGVFGFGNHILAENETSELISLLENGGKIYMEGTDTWHFNPQTSLHDWFGVEGIPEAPLADGDLGNIIGTEGSFTDGMAFEYMGENSFVDRLLPSGGVSILQNVDPAYVTAVAYEDQNIYYRTIASTHQLGGLEGTQFDDYINGIFEFFNDGSGIEQPECLLGDINSDNLFNITDVVRLINIIVNIGPDPSEYELCSSDINEDNLLNILDIVSLVNIILDIDRSYSLTHHHNIEDIIDSVTLEVNSNSLKIITDGVVQGIQLIVESNDEHLDVNKSLNLDVVYNKVDNIHYMIFYSPIGDYLDVGEHLLFRSDEEYKVHENIVSNTINTSVYVDSKVNLLQPDIFKLGKNYPNPFNPTTKFEIDLGLSENIQLIIYDINGRKIKELANGYYEYGTHQFTWDSTDDNGNLVSSGMYIYSLISKNQILSEKMLLMK